MTLLDALKTALAILCPSAAILALCLAPIAAHEPATWCLVRLAPDGNAYILDHDLTESDCASAARATPNTYCALASEVLH